MVGIEALLLIAAHSGRYARRLALFAGTTLGIFSFIVGAGAPRVQTRLLVSAVIGIGAAIAAGLLGARRSSTPSMLVIVVAALGATVGLAAIAPVRKIQLLAEGDFALTRAARTEFQRSLNYSYRAADQDLETLSRGEGLPRSLYVFGDPVLLLRANRPQAVAILGWGPKVLDEKAWRELDSELRSTLPQYIVVDRYIESVIRGRYPAIMHSIESRYRIAFIGASGTW